MTFGEQPDSLVMGPFNHVLALAIAGFEFLQAQVGFEFDTSGMTGGGNTLLLYFTVGVHPDLI